MRFRGSAILAVAVLTTAVAAPAAQATFPGRNGEIFFREGWQSRFHSPPNNVKAYNLRTKAIRTLGDCGADNCYWSDLGLSPDGQRLALLSNYGPQLGVMDTPTGSLTRIASPTYLDGRPRWSPDGQQLLVRSSVDRLYQLSILNLDGTQASVLAKDDPSHRGWALGWGDSYDWSSKGQIAFLGTVPYDCLDHCRSELFVARPGQTPRRLTHGGASGGDISWSPDGRWIAFVRNLRGLFLYGSFLYVIRADGTHLRRVTHRPGAYGPAWSPDGKRIAFLRLGIVHTLTPNGKHVRRYKRIAEDLTDPYTEGRDVNTLEWQALRR